MNKNSWIEIIFIIVCVIGAVVMVTNFIYGLSVFCLGLFIIAQKKVTDP